MGCSVQDESRGVRERPLAGDRESLCGGQETLLNIPKLLVKSSSNIDHALAMESSSIAIALPGGHTSRRRQPLNPGVSSKQRQTRHSIPGGRLIAPELGREPPSANTHAAGKKA